MASWNKNFRFSGEAITPWIQYYKNRNKKMGYWNKQFIVPEGIIEPDPFEKKLELWGRILPKKIREEYFGDLLEDRAILEKRGLSKRRVNMVTLGKVLFLLRAAHWEWLQDLVTSIFESIKELIP